MLNAIMLYSRRQDIDSKRDPAQFVLNLSFCFKVIPNLTSYIILILTR